MVPKELINNNNLIVNKIIDKLQTPRILII